MRRCIWPIIVAAAHLIALTVAFYAGFSYAERRAEIEHEVVIERLRHCLARLPYPWQYGYVRCVWEAKRGDQRFEPIAEEVR